MTFDLYFINLKLFKGGNYSRAETIRGNTVNINNNICDHYSRAETNQGRKLLIIRRFLLRKLFKGGNYSRKYGNYKKTNIFSVSCQGWKHTGSSKKTPLNTNITSMHSDCLLKCGHVQTKMTWLETPKCPHILGHIRINAKKLVTLPSIKPFEWFLGKLLEQRNH